MPVLWSLIDSDLAHKLKRSELWCSADGRKEGPGPSLQLGEKGGKGAVDKWVLHFELMRVRQGTHWQEGINERKGEAGGGESAPNEGGKGNTYPVIKTSYRHTLTQRTGQPHTSFLNPAERQA